MSESTSQNTQSSESALSPQGLMAVTRKPYCLCKKVGVNRCDCETCGAWLCRKHSFRYHQGLIYCKTCLPKSTLGIISVESVKYYDITDGVYIGREVATNKDYYAASLLANPYKVTQNSTQEDKDRVLINYKSWLFYEHIKLEDEVFDYLCGLRDMVLRGLDVRLLCWCKDENGFGKCHGEVVKAALEWMLK